MRAVAILSASVFCLTAFTVSAEAAQCFRKVGSVCKPGYGSGYAADCSTPCKAAPKGAMQEQPRQDSKPKPHQIISPTD